MVTATPRRSWGSFFRALARDAYCRATVALSLTLVLMWSMDKTGGGQAGGSSNGLTQSLFSIGSGTLAWVCWWSGGGSGARAVGPSGTEHHAHPQPPTHGRAGSPIHRPLTLQMKIDDFPKTTNHPLQAQAGAPPPPPPARR